MLYFLLVLGLKLGQVMWQANAERRPLPTIFGIRSGDSELMKAMKSLALDMTRFQPDERPTMDEVELRITDIVGTFANNDL